jgi:SAM-dependent methyltransferase
MHTSYDKEYFEAGTKSNYHGYFEIPQFTTYADKVMLFEPKSVLEVGCAYGFIVKKLRAAGVPRVDGVDISEYAVSKRVDDHVFLGDVTKGLLYGDKEFDLVCSFDILEHIDEKDVPAVVAELKRVGRRQYHHITYRENEPGKDITHVTLKPMHWWYDQFGDDQEVFLVESF